MKILHIILTTLLLGHSCSEATLEASNSSWLSTMRIKMANFFSRSKPTTKPKKINLLEELQRRMPPSETLNIEEMELSPAEQAEADKVLLNFFGPQRELPAPPPAETALSFKDVHIVSASYTLENTRSRFKTAAYPNQDRTIISANEDHSRIFFGVFDGHGISGDTISDYVSKKLSQETLKLEALSKMNLHDLVQKIINNLKTEAPIDSHHSGSTGIFGIYTPRNHADLHNLMIINLGDSRFVMGNEEDTFGTRDHCAKDPH